MFRTVSTPDPTPPLPHDWRRALASEIGHKDSGEESLKYVARVTPHEFGPLNVYDSELHYRATEIAEEVDKLRAWNVPFALIESRFGSVDRSEKRLIEPGSLAFKADEIERATLEAMQERARVEARTVAMLEGPYRGTCRDDKCVVISIEPGAPVPEWITEHKLKPRYVGEHLVSYHWLAAIPGWEGIEKLPQGYGRKSYSGSDVVPVPYKIGSQPTPPWTVVSSAEHNARIQFVPPDMSPRLAPTTAGRVAAREFLEEHAHLLRPEFFGWQKAHIRECVVRGFLVPPHIATDMEIDVMRGASRSQALASMRNWKQSATLEDVQAAEVTPGQRAEIAASYMMYTQAGRIVWGAMISTTLEKVTEGFKSLVAPIVEFLRDRTDATSEELSRVTGAPVESTDLAAAARASGLEKVRISVDGARKYLWRKS
jgi:hypothetical protein